MRPSLRATSSIGALLLTLPLVLVVAPAVRGQTLRGTIVDARSGEPVALAYAALLVEGRDMVVAGLASGTGAFTLQAPSAGSYFLYVARTGYETVMEGLFELGEDGVLELRVGLQPSPIALEPLVVEEQRQRSPLELAGFYDRAALGLGHFMTRDEIARVAVDRLSDAFRSIPSIGLDESRPMVGSPEVMRNPGLLVRTGGDTCSPTLYVDGAMVATGVLQPARPDDHVAPSDAEAIEVYTRSSEVPIEYAAVGDCGVVLIWTRMR